VPLSVVAVLTAIGIALALGSRAAAWLQAPRFVATLLLFGFGLVIAATITPDAPALEGIHSDGTCDFSRVGFASIGELTRVNNASLNVLLFVPLGIALGLLPRTRAAWVVTIAAFSLPFVIEAIQLLVTALGRGCQTADLFDNLLGLAIGIALGIFTRMIVLQTGVAGR
jgi:glycopeptide antibiotics resistance protein